jgi:hypothetical protein
MLEKKIERDSELQQRFVEERKRQGNIHIIRSDASGFFGRAARIPSGKIASISDYEVSHCFSLDFRCVFQIDLKKQLPPEWIPSSLNDILSKAVQFGKEPVLLLLRRLGQSASDVEAIDLYLDVCMPAAATASSASDSPARVPSAANAFTPFQGKGHSMCDSPATTSSPVVSPVTALHCFDRISAESIQQEVNLEPTKPVAKLQFLLPSGKKIVSHFHATHTIKDVKLALRR